MNTLKIKLTNIYYQYRNSKFRSLAVEAVIPPEVLQLPMTTIKFQIQVSDHVAVAFHTQSLNKLAIWVCKNEFHDPLLTSLLQSLE